MIRDFSETNGDSSAWRDLAPRLERATDPQLRRSATCGIVYRDRVSVRIPRPIIYIRIAPELVSVRDIGMKRQYEGAPLVAVDAQGRIVAIGPDVTEATRAGAGGITLRNPFADSAAGTAEIVLGAQVLAAFLAKIGRRHWPGPLRWLLGYDMVVQVVQAGGEDLTAAMREAIKGMAKRAGARRVRLVTGTAALLSDEGVRSAFVLPTYSFDLLT
jgi:hypothetical protein